MFKRIITLVIAACILSAGFLFLGITIIGHSAPQLGSTLDALVAGKLDQNSISALPESLSARLSNYFGGNKTQSEEKPSEKIVLAIPQSSAQPLKMSAVVIASEPPAAVVKIGDLIANPGLYKDQIVSLSGTFTILDEDKILLNDGTGSVLVEIDKDHVDLKLMLDQTITVTGRLDDFDSAALFELEACSLIYLDQTVVLDDCENDDLDEDDQDDDDSMDDDDETLDDDSDDDDDTSEEMEDEVDDDEDDGMEDEIDDDVEDEIED